MAADNVTLGKRTGLTVKRWPATPPAAPAPVKYNDIGEAIRAMEGKRNEVLDENFRFSFMYSGLNVEASARSYQDDKGRTRYRIRLEIDLASQNNLIGKISEALGASRPCTGENFPVTPDKSDIGTDYCIFLRNEVVPNPHRKFMLYQLLANQPKGKDMANLLGLAHDSTFKVYIDSLK